MGTSPSRSSEYIKLTKDQRTLVKQVWSGIETNPQFHGSVFFMGFCEIHPQYTKYFTSDSEIPLIFDARTNAKFTIIMETMGYLLLDFHNNPKQLDRIIGYVAMIHKDMSLERSDMFNFGVSLMEYLRVSFPMVTTSDALEVVSKYMNNLLTALSQKIEEFKSHEILGDYEISDKAKMSWCCGCNENLIYGQTLDYWKRRKIRWEERLDDWKLKEGPTTEASKSSSTEDEETSMRKSRTEDETSEFAESTARLLESHGIPRTTRFESALTKQSLVVGSPSEKIKTATRALEEPKNRDHVVDGASGGVKSIYRTPRERRRSVVAVRASRAVKPREFARKRLPNIFDESTQNSSTEHSDFLALPSRNKKIDSLARQRRRLAQSRLDLT